LRHSLGGKGISMMLEVGGRCMASPCTLEKR
jgi:hypothetical protein